MAKLSKEELEKKQKAKVIADERKFLKEQGDNMSLEYNYMFLMMELPKMRAQFEQYMKAQEDAFKARNEQVPVKMAEESLGEVELDDSMPDNVIKMDTGAKIVTEE